MAFTQRLVVNMYYDMVVLIAGIGNVRTTNLMNIEFEMSSIQFRGRSVDWWNSGMTAGSADWEGFGAQVSGEWDGYSAEFNFAGEPIQLPSNIVPDAFRDWGVEIHDWQTQCPTLAHPDKGHLWYKVIRLHPTVGCEADAATVYGVEPCDVQQSASALVYHSSGSYTIVWRGKRVTRENSGSGPGKEVSRVGDEIEVEQCLVHERKRIRVLQHLDPRSRVMVFREAWEGPFRNGESLGGCAIGTPAFATQNPLQPSALIGTWRTDVHSAENLQHHQVHQFLFSMYPKPQALNERINSNA